MTRRELPVNPHRRAAAALYGRRMNHARLAIIGVVLGLGRTAMAADPAELDQLRTSARGLASNGYCDAVRDVAKQVRAIDELFYNTVFLTDRVIASCGALPGPEIGPPGTHAAAAALHARHGLTFDVEVGGGFGGYAEASGTAATLNAGAGLGVFVTERLAIGVRGFGGASRTTGLSYTPPTPANEGIGVPSYPVALRGKPSSAMVLVDAQRWAGDGLWYGFGAGVGRAYLAPTADNPGQLTYSLATAARAGMTVPGGFELSCAVTAISGAFTQVDIAFLVGWHRL